VLVFKDRYERVVAVNAIKFLASYSLTSWATTGWRDRTFAPCNWL